MKNIIMLPMVVLLIAGSCLMAETEDTVTIALFRLGEDDAGAVAGNTGNDPPVEEVQGLEAILNGDPTYSSDVSLSGSNLSMDFDGDDYYSLGTNVSAATDNFGFEAWVKADALDGFNFVASNGTNFGGYGLVQVGGKWGILAMGVSGAFDGADVAVGQWQHVAVVWDSGTATLYVDGVASQTDNAVPNPIDSSFTIGANDKVEGGSENTNPFAPVYEGHWKGLIDHVRLFHFESGRFDPNDLSYNTIIPGSQVGSVSQTADETVVQEGEITDSFDVVLVDGPPSADVVVVVDPNVAFSSTSSEISLNGADAGESIELTFTSANWDTPQTVQVAAIDDTQPDMAMTAVVQFTLTSADAAFDGGYIPAVSILVIDNDSAAYAITETDDDTIVDEEGETTDTFTIALATAPTQDVQVTLAELNEPNDVLVSPLVLTFTPSDFDVPQTVTVQAVDDVDIEAHPHEAPVRLTASSSDLGYDGLTIDVIVSVNENECGAIGYNAADFNEDCIVNMEDFALFAAQWLQCSFPHIAGCP